MMYRRSVITLTLLLMITSTFAQPCRYVTPFSEMEQQILINYINDSVNRNFFRNGKGVVRLSISSNQTGKKEWHLSSHLDDQFMTSPPPMWTIVAGEVILISDENSTKGTLSDSLLAARRLCLQSILADRVYAKTTQQRKFIIVGNDGKVVFERDGIPKLKDVPSPIYSGNLNNSLVVEFLSDGTFKLKAQM